MAKKAVSYLKNQCKLTQECSELPIITLSSFLEPPSLRMQNVSIEIIFLAALTYLIQYQGSFSLESRMIATILGPGSRVCTLMLLMYSFLHTCV